MLQTLTTHSAIFPPQSALMCLPSRMVAHATTAPHGLTEIQILKVHLLITKKNTRPPNN